MNGLLKKNLSAFCLGFALLASQPVMANQASLYERLGGLESIRAVIDDFVVRVGQDPRIGQQFANANGPRLASLLTDQVCEATGGPCTYNGLDMKTSHAGMTITKADFNALVEVLQASMREKGVPMSLQLEVLALLAPMHRDIITVR